VSETLDESAQADLDKIFEKMFIEEETDEEPDEPKEIRQNLE
jgi:hypothetical protein